jgi:hypothetical protein
MEFLLFGVNFSLPISVSNLKPNAQAEQHCQSARSLIQRAYRQLMSNDYHNNEVQPAFVNDSFCMITMRVVHLLMP